ncbi:MAG: hypothetical protein GX104_03125 [Spirochaetales bacterium]|nr:hypothetical protein [Spirochaetales bacterium]
MAKKLHIGSEIVRKFIHIGVTNWWFIYLWAFDEIIISLIGPIVFIMANAAAVFTGAANILGVSDKRRNYGLIYFPISLFIVIGLIHLDVLSEWAATIGVLTMGYADGFAALVGKKWGKAKKMIFGGEKSFLGSLTIFIVTFLIVIIVSYFYQIVGLWSFGWWIKALLIAATATVFEMCTPWGLDNLTVPLGAAFTSMVLMS